MTLRDLLPRLIAFCCLCLAITACTSAASAPARSTPSTPPAAPWQALQKRPLHLPVLAVGAPCPTSPEKQVSPAFGIAQGAGPAYATIGTEVMTSPALFGYADAQHFADGAASNQGWGGQKVLWFVNPSYQGLVLVRGQQLDGPHAMRFNGPPSDQPLSPHLVLDTRLGGGTPWPNFPSYTRLQAPGCYAYQVDGATFSSVIVFQAVVQN